MSAPDRSPSPALLARWNDVAEGVVAFDADLLVLWANDALGALLGASLDDWLGHAPWDFVHPDDLGRVSTSFSGLHDHPGRRGPATYRLRHTAGHYVLARVSGLNLLDDPEFGVLVLEVRPVEEEQRAEALATDQYETLEHLLAGQALDDTLLEIVLLVERHGEGLTAAILLIDDAGTGFRVAAAPNLPAPLAALMQGFPVGPHAGLTANEAVRRVESAVSADLAVDPLWDAHAATATASGMAACWSVAILNAECTEAIGSVDVYRSVPGEPRLEDWALPMLAARLAGIAIDRRGWIAELEHQSNHDALTGLLNRRAFVAELERLLEPSPSSLAAEVALLFIDLDRFKVVNDTHGHDVGDVVLREAGLRLADAARDATNDHAVVARLGGDEFVVAWGPCFDAAEAIHVAERLRYELDRVLSVGPIRVTPRVSIGVALAAAIAGPSTPPSADLLLRNADAALNRAKADGRNRWVFYDDALRQSHLERRATEADLERAIERGELRVFFQPVVALGTNRLAGIEALVRWEHPLRGLLPPAAFIDVAEDAGLVTGIDEQVLDGALPIVERWNASRAERELDPLTLWVNLSAHHLMQPDAVDHILRRVEAGAIVRSPLGVELTESALLADPVAAAGLLARLRGAGIGVAIDDFGTGYSSLAALRTLPATHLKIDRRFVNGLLTDSRDRAIVEATLQLGHAFGLGVTAEGVETPDQADELTRLGCDLAQGFLYGRPVPAEALESAFGVGLLGPALPT